MHGPSEIFFLCRAARRVFLSQPMLLRLTVPPGNKLKFVGDIHGFVLKSPVSFNWMVAHAFLFLFVGGEGGG